MVNTYIQNVKQLILKGEISKFNNDDYFDSEQED